MEDKKIDWDSIKVESFENLSTDELMKSIFEYEKEKHDIDWLESFKTPQGIKNAAERVKKHLSSEVAKLSKDELSGLSSSGFLKDGGVDHLFKKDSFACLVEDESVNYFPAWGWKPETAKGFANATGDDLKNKIVELTKSMQVLAGSDSGAYWAKRLMQIGVYGIGSAALIAVVRIARTLISLAGESGLYAIFEGVITIGVNALKVIFGVVVLAVLIPLMVFMDKDASYYSIIVNFTKEDQQLDGTITDGILHGKPLVAFETDTNKNDLTIPASFSIVNKDGKVIDSSMNGGFFVTRKKDEALVGTQGAIKFKKTELFPKGVYLAWDVPLTGGKNGVALSCNATGTPKDFSKDNNDRRSLADDDKATTGASATVHLHSTGGSIAYGCLSLKPDS